MGGVSYSSPIAREFALHGFCRRWRLLRRAVENVFRLLPLDHDEIPSDETRIDATINIQAIVFNVFGSLDNLAWIVVHERPITDKTGALIHRSKVGLGPKCKEVRQALSPDMKDYLESISRWFDGLEDFRHALAHRIPLYVPPYTVDPSRAQDYENLSIQMDIAMREMDLETHKRLAAEQLNLAKFQPLYTHSLSEGAHQMVLHAQVLADFNTVNEIGNRMLVELGR